MNILHSENMNYETTFSGALKYVLKNPITIVFWCWNWKSAFFSALLRSPVFFFAYYKEGVALAFGAMAAQFFSRAIFGGANGAIIQSFSKVNPAWHAVLTVPLGLAVFSHIIEFIVQRIYDTYTGTQSVPKAIAVSVVISVLSAMFNFFAMQRGALLVKDQEQKSLWKDITSMPRIVFDFIMFPAHKIAEMFSKGAYLQGVLLTVATSGGFATVVGLIRGRIGWGRVTFYWGLAFLVSSVIIISLMNARKFEQENAEKLT